MTTGHDGANDGGASHGAGDMGPSQLADWTYDRLVEEYGIPDWKPDGDMLGGLVSTILSQHTSDVNAERAYASLRLRFPTWEQMRDAPRAGIEAAVRTGGLAERKAEYIQETLVALTTLDPEDPFALSWLDTENVERAREQLVRLPGVGMKTASCALLFSQGRPAFPVDTHVARVTKRLGMIDNHLSADAAHVALERIIPPARRHTMHINLITHGRRVCHARQPACERCVLSLHCMWWALQRSLAPSRPQAPQ